MMVKYKIVNQDEVTTVTAYVRGTLFCADDSHPNFDAIVGGLISGDVDVDLFDLSKTVAARFEPLSERVAVAGGVVYFDNDPVDNSLTQQILRFLEEGEDFEPLVNFFEKVAQNPEPHSREQLYRWLDKHRFTITDAGDFIAYKGVHADTNGYRSVYSGAAIVNGQWTPAGEGVLQNVDDVVEMPRSAVHHDPSQGCSTGLHAGTYGYASGYGNVVLTVVINPRDVVSVPTDSSDQKLRVCRYTILDVAESEYEGAYYDQGYDDTQDDLNEPEDAPEPAYRECDNGDGNKHHARGLCRKCYGRKYGR